MDTSTFTPKQPVVEQNAPGPNRLPAGSTLEISSGVRVPHPEAAATPAGIEDPRKTGIGVNELLDGTQTPLKDRGSLGKDEDGDGIVEVNTVGKPTAEAVVGDGKTAESVTDEKPAGETEAK
jgi:hypothetical protein